MITIIKKTVIKKTVNERLCRRAGRQIRWLIELYDDEAVVVLAAAVSDYRKDPCKRTRSYLQVLLRSSEILPDYEIDNR